MVAEATLRRVRDAANSLGYIPNPAARALAQARSNTLAVIIPSVTNQVFAELLRGVYDAVEESGLQVQLANTRYRPTREEDLLRLFAAQRPAGAIVAGIDQTPVARRLLGALDCPVVQVMELCDDPIDMVIGCDQRAAAADAVGHLLGRGYRRIGFLGARMDPRAQRRMAGWRDRLEQAGLHGDELMLTTPHPSSVTVGSRMLAEFLAMVPDADAVFCNNDDVALGALFECQRRGIRVPAQFGIMGFNDLEMVSVSNPAISSVATHRYEMGGLAVAMLQQAARGERPERTIVDTGHTLMIRGSSAR
jgi:LacI family transcriptional regulator, gluconate utilization system Gnt-I transcriptional repressor